jgi:putative hydrolase of the HAD superfamily
MSDGICVVFDIDDTLYLERDYVLSGFEAVGRWAETWLNIEYFADRCWCKFLDGGRGLIFNDVLRECGVRATPELIAALVEIYRTHVPSIALADDAAETLTALSPLAAIAVVSDGPAVSQSRKAEALRLSTVARPIILTDVLGKEYRKPHPLAFELIQERRPAHTYLYVADNPHKDFAAPMSLGWMTIRVRRPNGLHSAVETLGIKPDREIDDCSPLPEVVKQL